MGDFISQIQVEKVRHLENFNIDIADDEVKHLIITGKNGSGKTTLLERIKAYLKAISDENLLKLVSQWPQHLRSSEKEHERLIATANKDLQQQSRITELEGMIKRFTRAIKSYADGIKIIFNNDSRVVEKYAKGEYILAYFNATRNVSIDIPVHVPKIQLQDKYNIEDNIGNMFLNYLVYLKTQQSFARNENDLVQADKIEVWFDKFENALRDLFEDESISLKFDYKNLNFKINQEGREPYGFDVLSDGYSAVLDIIINLILRMEREHKQAYDIEGIVIIDELENHLHIALQKKILPFLTDFFPNIQFIISTHSPFIINSIDNAVIFDLETRQRVEDLSGIAYEGIVEGYFDINQYSEKIKSKLERYNVLVDKQDKVDADQEEEYELRRYLKSISPDLAPEVALAFNNIEIERKNRLRSNG